MINQGIHSSGCWASLRPIRSQVGFGQTIGLKIRPRLFSGLILGMIFFLGWPTNLKIVGESWAPVLQVSMTMRNKCQSNISHKIMCNEAYLILYNFVHGPYTERYQARLWGPCMFAYKHTWALIQENTQPDYEAHVHLHANVHGP